MYPDEFAELIGKYPTLDEIPMNSFTFKLMFLTAEEIDKLEALKDTDQFKEGVILMMMELQKIILSLISTLTESKPEMGKDLYKSFCQDGEDILKKQIAYMIKQQEKKVAKGGYDALFLHEKTQKNSEREGT